MAELCGLAIFDGKTTFISLRYIFNNQRKLRVLATKCILSGWGRLAKLSNHFNLYTKGPSTPVVARKSRNKEVPETQTSGPSDCNARAPMSIHQAWSAWMLEKQYFFSNRAGYGQAAGTRISGTSSSPGRTRGFTGLTLSRRSDSLPVRKWTWKITFCTFRWNWTAAWQALHRCRKLAGLLSLAPLAAASASWLWKYAHRWISLSAASKQACDTTLTICTHPSGSCESSSLSCLQASEWGLLICQRKRPAKTRFTPRTTLRQSDQMRTRRLCVTATLIAISTASNSARKDVWRIPRTCPALRILLSQIPPVVVPARVTAHAASLNLGSSPWRTVPSTKRSRIPLSGHPCGSSGQPGCGTCSSALTSSSSSTVRMGQPWQTWHAGAESIYICTSDAMDGLTDAKEGQVQRLWKKESFSTWQYGQRSVTPCLKCALHCVV